MAACDRPVEGQAAADHPALLAAYDLDSDGARGRADLHRQQVGGAHDSGFTQKTYVHASDDDLQRGQAALARIHKIVWGFVSKYETGSTQTETQAPHTP
jgi:hypothetical protein